MTKAQFRAGGNTARCVQLCTRRAAAILAMLGAAPTLAQTISNGDSTFAIPPANTSGALVRTGSFGGSGITYVAGGDGTNQVFQQWWWYRVSGVNGREFALSNLTGASAAGNTMTLSYAEPEGFTASLTYTLTDGTNIPAQANLESSLRITNNSAVTRSISVYCYYDPDLEGQFADGATLDELGRIRFVDNGTGFFGEMLGVNRDAYMVGAHPSVRNLLIDLDADTLNDTGLPFAPADATTAMQWNLTISPGASERVFVALSLNQEAQTCGSLVGDTNGDGNVNLADLATLLTFFGTSGGVSRAQGNLDGDNDVDLSDLALLLANFGTSC